MLKNGAIVASPSTEHPDYYYDWVRDSAIAMGLISKRYQNEQRLTDKKRLLHYVDWVMLTQNQVSPHGVDVLGEPKFYITGQVYVGAWGRPQNDGPALRAMALIGFANALLTRGESEYVGKHLYQRSLDPSTMGVIKKDLEYTAHHWQEANFDLWEEVYGQHFFTAMVQHRALVDGAKLANRLNDPEAANFYSQQAQAIKQQLSNHLNPSTGLIDATLSPHPGPQKLKELDSAVLLGVLLTLGDDNVIELDNAYLKNTIESLHDYFKQAFPINHSLQHAILFGRYPGDTYDGYQTDGQGNPWFILTATMAEYYYAYAYQIANQQGACQQAEEMAKLGDSYLRLVKRFAPQLRMNEQIHLSTGVQQGADSLTWSYTAVLRAIDAERNYENLIASSSRKLHYHKMGALIDI
jgi:glucoamylase